MSTLRMTAGHGLSCRRRLAPGGALAALAASCLVALAPDRAAAFEWGASLGAIYSRQDTTNGFDTSTAPMYDLNLGLHADGSIGGRGVVDWAGSGYYRFGASEVDGTQVDAQNEYGFNLVASVFQNDRSPLGLAFRASRADNEHSSDLRPGVVGTYVVDTLGASGRYAFTPVAGLSLGYVRTDLDVVEPGTLHREQQVQTLSASLQQGSGPFTAAISYAGTFSDGTFVADRYATHNVSTHAAVSLPREVGLFISDQYYVRRASSEEPTAYGFDVHFFDASLAGKPSSFGDDQQLRYHYFRSTTEPAGGEVLASARHGITYRGYFPLRPRWFLRGTADVSMSDSRNGATAVRTFGETLGAELAWRRTSPSSSDEIRAGPQVTVLQVPGDEGDALGYGGTAAATTSRTWGVNSVNGQYTLDFGSNAYGASGWRFSQTLTAAVSRPFSGGTVAAQLLGMAARSSTPAIGDQALRRLSLNGSWLGRFTALSVGAGLDSGMSAVASTSLGLSDGLIVPAPFDQHTAYVSLSGSASLPWDFTAHGSYSHSSVLSPDQPARTMNEVTAGLAYAFGALSVSVDDRYTTSDLGSGAYTNVFMFRLFRTIGAR